MTTILVGASGSQQTYTQLVCIDPTPPFVKVAPSLIPKPAQEVGVEVGEPVEIKLGQPNYHLFPSEDIELAVDLADAAAFLEYSSTDRTIKSSRPTTADEARPYRL